MKIRTNRIINAMILPVLLSSCMADEPDAGMTQPANYSAEATRAVETRPVFRDIQGIDPTLPGQYVKLDFPVVLEGDTTLITGNFSVMPYHCWEENGEDKAGDYYVVEADFTAHNGTLSRSFMKELDVQVKLRDKDGGTVPEGRFYDFPTPGTTIANKEYVNSSATTVAGTGYIGSVAPYVTGGVYPPKCSYQNGTYEYQMLLINGRVLKKTFSTKITFNIMNGDQVSSYRVKRSDIMVSRPSEDGMYLFFTGRHVPKELTDRVFKFRNRTGPSVGPVDNVNLYVTENGRNITDEQTKVLVDENMDMRSSETADPGYRNFDRFKLRRLGKGKFGFDYYYLEFDINEDDRAGLEDFTVDSKLFYQKPVLALGVEGHVGMGFGWSKSQQYYDLDKSTLLNTSGHDLHYTYKVGNTADKDRGLPAVATGDLHGHSAWAWRISMKESAMTTEELADSLFRVEVTVGAVYGDRDDVKANRRPGSGSVLTRSFALDAPMRAKTGSVTFTNRMGNPVRNVKLLSVPYDVWAASGYDDQYVLSRSEGSLCTGQSRTMTVTGEECYLVCEPVDRRTFKPTGYRHTDRIDIKLDPLEAGTTNVSTTDLDN